MERRGETFRCEAEAVMRLWDWIMKLARHSIVVLLLLVSAAWTPVGASVKSKDAQPWRAIHLLDYNSDTALDALGRTET